MPASELKKLAPTLLEAKHTKLTDGGDVTAALWQGDKSSLLVVANLTDALKPVSIVLPKGLVGSLKPEFAGRPTGLKIAEGKVVGEIGKAEVHLYRISGD